jgi:hypothetical protein
MVGSLELCHLAVGYGALPEGHIAMTVTGLRQRLEAIHGVSSIQLELGDSGLTGIRVTLAEGADEAMVLERIRAMLVTYGLKAPETGAPGPSRVFNSEELVTEIAEEGQKLRVEVKGDGEAVVTLVDATPLAAARAVALARGQLTGHSDVEVMWIGLDQIGSWRILTVLASIGDETVSAGSAVVTSGWADALDRAVAAALA